MRRDIVVITTSCSLYDISLPIQRTQLEYIIAENSGFSQEEEQTIMRWADDVSVSGIPFPLDESRRITIKEGGRTSRTEDTLLAKWVIEVWETVSLWRSYA